MTNPKLVEVWRGDGLESVHRGSVAICDSSGNVIAAVGDISTSIFPRSSIKIMQALPLVEEGAADGYGFGDKELALACSSHNGELLQINMARSMLNAAGLTEDALECGPQMPRIEKDAESLLSSGKRPLRIHNNCSGKHSGMLAVAKHRGISHLGYVDKEHPIQMSVTQAIAELIDHDLTDAPCGQDGCSIPTYAAPLRCFAGGFAKMVSGEKLSPLRKNASQRLMQACMVEPYMTAGTDRFCTDIMTALKGKAYVKTGAEGVFCAAIPNRNFGIAVKCDDGSTRGAEAIVAAVLTAVLEIDSSERIQLEKYTHAEITNWAGLKVGHIQTQQSLFDDLKQI